MDADTKAKLIGLGVLAALVGFCVVAWWVAFWAGPRVTNLIIAAFHLIGGAMARW